MHMDDHLDDTLARTSIRSSRLASQLAVTRAIGALALASLGACDFKVTNPGPVESTFLEKSAAAAAIVNGAGRDLGDALNWLAYTGAVPARELFPDGSTGSFGITVQQQVGRLADDESNTHWNLSQRARFEAESGSQYLQTSLPDYAKNKLAGQILLWAGYANRLLGENMCQAVINGGAAQASTVFLTRADSELTLAITVATAAADTKTATAAKAARAAVRADLGRWADAVADANGIADAFSYQMPYYVTDVDQYNRIYWATANQPYRAHTVKNTVNEQYYTDTKDPRVPWGSDPKVPVGDAAVLTLGSVPWYFEQKYTARTSPINLSTGWEMRLIEAEARLVANDVPGAMPLINKHRAALGLAPWTATTAADAWTALKRERGIELWLEGRRLNDLRRWKASNTPGTLSSLEMPGTVSSLTNQDLCFPISLTEKQTNPNLNGGT